MTEPTGHVCPECAAHRALDGTPSCACTSRASDALRDERTAQAAAAEDFNPLRIRPYVELGTEHSGHSGGQGDYGPAGGTGGTGPAGTPAGPWQAAPTAGEPWAAPEAGGWAPEGATAPVSAHGAPQDGNAAAGALDGAPPVAYGEDATGATMQLSAIPADATMRFAPVPADPGPRSVPLPPEVPMPSAQMPADATMQLKALSSDARATDVRLFHERARSSEPGPVDPPSERPRRRRRTGVLAVTGVVVTMVAAAGVASGLLSYDPPSRDGAQPEDVRASVPDVLSDTASALGSASASSSASASASASSSPSTSASPSASASDTSASPSSSATASPTSARPSPTATATGSTGATGGGPAVATGPTLRRGDSGAEVTELQMRLSQLRMYMHRADGQFDRHVEDAVRWYQWARGITGDDPGVYGPATRASLEAETSQP
ncbi:peptidoglycan-binding protein [Streptomyces sp. f51]|uniref:peptidoglycan-binding protein n=1 Tax=Streptomyces sp. f51 TaxID=1827742 RepID=UPI0030CC04EB